MDPLLLAGGVTAAVFKLVHDAYHASAHAHQTAVRRRSPHAPSVIVVGAGISGMCACIKLKQAGIDNVTVFEKHSDVGGTWFANRYPGVACDVPAHGYSFSFELNPDWSTAYAPGSEIQEYLRMVAKKYDVYKHVTFNAEVLGLEYDQQACEWVCTAKVDGKMVTRRARIVLSCVGGLQVPAYPPAPGVCSNVFKGVEVHSADWTIKSLDEIKGKNVVVVGSAASAVQIVPEIADLAKSLTVIQRTPNWLAPQHGPWMPPFSLEYPAFIKWMFRHVPGALRFYRIMVYLSMEFLRYPLNIFSSSSIGQALTKRVLTAYMKMFLKGNKDLEAKVIPTYQPGCKRIIRSEKFLPALLKSNVRLVTSALAKVEADAVILDNGERIPSEVNIYATGFKVGSVGNLKVQSPVSSDLKIEKGLADDYRLARMYKGSCHPAFPNTFLLLGPNTGLGHNSIIIVIEAQVNYIVGVITKMVDDKIKEVTVKQELVDDYANTMKEGFKGSVWTAPGCKSWYQSANGEVHTLYPFSTVRMIREMQPPNRLEEEFHIKRAEKL